jgi:hypothetical protein
MQDLSLFESNSQPFTVDNHLSLNFNDLTNLKPTTFSSLTETKSYTPITGCVLEHVLTTTNLTSCEKLYYLLAESLSLISKNKGKSRSCALPSEDWAEYLGCSRSLVFAMQQSLVQKGYFIINKDFDAIGRNKRNLITPTLPNSVFNNLNEKYPDRVGDHAPYNPLNEYKRAYLDRTKLFIKLNYDLLKIITSNEYMNPWQKIMWLGFYGRGYKNYILQSREGFDVNKYSYNDDSSLSFISSYRELAEQYSCSTKHLSKSLRRLEELGFIKTQNIYVRKKDCKNDDSIVQERQDLSLWKITLSLPRDCILELEKVKDRSNLKLKDVTTVTNASLHNPGLINQKLTRDCVILEGMKFSLSTEQAEVLKSVLYGGSNDYHCSGDTVDITTPLLPAPRIQCAEPYIDSVMEELNTGDTDNLEDELEESFEPELKAIDLLSDEPKALSCVPTLTHAISSSSSFPREALDNKDLKTEGIKSDPHVAKSRLLYNKDLKRKIIDIKSNLRTKSKVAFNEFLKRFKNEEPCENINNKKEGIAKDEEFNIYSELIRNKLKELPKDKADKARRFAYSLVSKGLACGYAASLSKHELAKQIIHHAVTWKPTRLGSVSREKEIDTALSVAWKKIVGGAWQVPLELAKAEILQYEFEDYGKKYRESGIIAHEVKDLESEVNKLLGGWCDLKGKITRVTESKMFDDNSNEGGRGNENNERNGDSNRNVDSSISSNRGREELGSASELRYNREEDNYVGIPFEEEQFRAKLEENNSD